MTKNPEIRPGEDNSRQKAVGSNREPPSADRLLPTADWPRGRPPRAGSSFAARFGRVILQHGIAAIPSALYHYQGKLGLSAQQVWFVSYILSHKWDEDLPYPSLKKLARCSRLSLSQVQRIKNSLCQPGYLQVYTRFSDRRAQDTNSYDFSGLFDALEKLIVGDAPIPNAIRAEGALPDLAELSELDPSFTARYGRVIARHGVAAVPRAVFTHQAALGLTPQQVWFITYIFSFQWATTLPYPSIRRMASVTGYSRVQLHNIKTELMDAGYLTLVHRSNDQGGQDTNAYDFSGLLEAIRNHLRPVVSPPHDETDTPSTDRPPAGLPPMKRRGRRSTAPDLGVSGLPGGSVTRLTGADSAQLPEGGRTELPVGGRIQFTAGDSAQLPGGVATQLPGPDNRATTTGVAHAYPRGIARDLHEEEAIQIESNKKKDDSNQQSRNNKSTKRKRTTDLPNAQENTRPLPFSPYIAAVITDFSNELNDPNHVIPNVSQTLRLWQRSGLDEQGFAELLFEARRRTRLYQGKQGLSTIANKMAYFFTVLRDLLPE